MRLEEFYDPPSQTLLVRQVALEAARAAFEKAADECRSYDDCQVILEMAKELE